MPRDNEDGTEETPLLHDGPECNEPPLDDASKAKARADRNVILNISVIVFLFIAADYFFDVPASRIMEDILCHQYYKDISKDIVSVDGKIDEKLCKGEEIQKELATIIAGIQMIAFVCSLCVSYPYGMLADKYGRKKVFLLCMFGNVLLYAWITMVCWWPNVFPLRTVLIGPFFTLVGGGDAVLQNCLFAIMTDCSTIATRSNAFFLAQCGLRLAQLLGPACVAYLMPISPWIPRFMSFGIWIVGFV